MLTFQFTRNILKRTPVTSFLFYVDTKPGRLVLLVVVIKVLVITLCLLELEDAISITVTHTVRPLN